MSVTLGVDLEDLQLYRVDCETGGTDPVGYYAVVKDLSQIPAALEQRHFKDRVDGRITKVELIGDYKDCVIYHRPPHVVD